MGMRFGKETRMLLPPQGWICTHHRPIGHAAWNKKKASCPKNGIAQDPQRKAEPLGVSWCDADHRRRLQITLSIITAGARQAPLWWRVGWTAEDGSASNNSHLHLVAVEMTIHFPTAWRLLVVLLDRRRFLWEDDPVPSPRTQLDK